jgi:hypothetical protein
MNQKTQNDTPFGALETIHPNALVDAHTRINDPNMDLDTCEYYQIPMKYETAIDGSVIRSIDASQTPFAKLTNRLFLSSANQAQNFPFLKDIRVTHVLNLTGEKLGTNELRYGIWNSI